VIDPGPDGVEKVLRGLYGIASTSRLRPEERKKIPQIAALIERLARIGGDPLLVDAAAGRAPVGLIAARILGWRKLVVIEQDPGRAESARRAAESLVGTDVDIRVGRVADPSCWPDLPEVVVALHACGPASDDVVDAVLVRRARHLLLVPCCYAHAVRASPRAVALAGRLGISVQPAIRRRFVQAIVDTERTLRLEAGGYRVSVGALVPPTLTPHNLVWEARWIGSEQRQNRAREKLKTLFAPVSG
jgi:hypothetical protein